MRSFAPDPEKTVDIGAMRLLRHLEWHGPAHRAPWRRDPLGALSLLVLGVGAVLLSLALLALCVIGVYVLLT